MKQSVCIEYKTIDLVEEYAGNVKVLKIHERHRAFSSIKFKISLVPWFVMCWLKLGGHRTFLHSLGQKTMVFTMFW